jgi:glutathione S-transferase
VTHIFHIASAEDWRAAQLAGTYRQSTRARSLEEVGFIHCSYVAQVTTVANTICRGSQGLVLIKIDPERLDAALRIDPAPPSGELFPHIYGPLNVDAVIEVVPFEPSADGTFHLPPGVA